jgi:hypothetical protein
MKTKHLLYLLILFVILFGVVKGVEFLGRGDGATKVRDFIAVKPDAYDTVEIAQPGGETVVLEQRNGAWRVAAPVDYPANASNVNALTARLEEVKSENIISSNPDNHVTYEVDEATGTRVSLKRGENVIESFYVGKISPDGNHTYMRSADAADVHFVRGMLTGLFERPVNDWRDKSILAVDQQAVNRVAIVKGGEQTVLTRAGATWQVQQGDAPAVAADTNKANELLATLGALNALGFVEETAAADLDFAAADTVVSVVMQDGTTHTLRLLAGDAYYLDYDRLTQVFEIAEYQYEQLGRMGTHYAAAAEPAPVE